MGVHDGHRERRRALFRRCGEDAFADHELLEVLLFYAIPRKDTNPIAHALIDQFGSLQAVLAASPEELESVPEVGPSASTLIALVSALYRKALASAASDEVVLDTRARVGDFFVKLLASESKEVLYQLCLDAKGRKLNLYKISEGAVGNVPLDLRKIVKNALHSKATMVVMAHNHPSGVAFPSPDDEAATCRIVDTLEEIGVRLADHIIVADNDYISMRESRMIR